MALSSLLVRIGADLSGLDKDLAKADRLVERFGSKISRTGRSLERMGHGASAAAGSLSRLSGVLPGVAGSTASMVATLGTASLVMGETAILSTALTKSWRLLGVASTAIAASSLPAWLAGLASPAGLAVLAVGALAAAVYGLKKAWDAATGPGKAMTKVLEDYQKSIAKIDTMATLKEQTARLQADFDAVTAALNAERSKKSRKIQMTGQGQIEVGGANQVLVQRLAGAQKLIADQMFAVGEQLQKLMGEAAKDAEKKWADAAEAAKKKWKEFGESLRDITGPLGELSRVNLTAATDRDFAGNAMGRALDPSRLKDELVSALGRSGVGEPGIQPKDKEKKERTLGTEIGEMLGGAGGGIVQAFAAFGPMAAIIPVISGALEALEPVLVTLIEPLVEIGRIIGDALAPILEMLAPVLKLVVDLFTHNLAPILKGITTALSYVMEAFGWLVRAIGRAVDALPGVSAKRVINAGQEMIDAAKAARRNTDATNKATEAVNDFAGALSNIPRVLNINALRHMIGGSGGGGGGGGGGGNGGGGVPVNPVRPGFEVRGDFIVQINGATDPARTAEMVGREIDRRISRGGTNRLAVRFA